MSEDRLLVLALLEFDPACRALLVAARRIRRRNPSGRRDRHQTRPGQRDDEHGHVILGPPVEALPEEVVADPRQEAVLDFAPLHDTLVRPAGELGGLRRHERTRVVVRHDVPHAVASKDKVHVLPVPLPRLDLRRADDRLPPPAQLAVGLVVVVAERAGHPEDLPVRLADLGDPERHAALLGGGDRVDLHGEAGRLDPHPLLRQVRLVVFRHGHDLDLVGRPGRPPSGGGLRALPPPPPHEDAPAVAHVPHEDGRVRHDGHDAGGPPVARPGPVPLELVVDALARGRPDARQERAAGVAGGGGSPAARAVVRRAPVGVALEGVDEVRRDELRRVPAVAVAVEDAEYSHGRGGGGRRCVLAAVGFRRRHVHRVADQDPVLHVYPPAVHLADAPDERLRGADGLVRVFRCRRRRTRERRRRASGRQGRRRRVAPADEGRRTPPGAHTLPRRRAQVAVAAHPCPASLEGHPAISPLNDVWRHQHGAPGSARRQDDDSAAAVAPHPRRRRVPPHAGVVGAVQRPLQRPPVRPGEALRRRGHGAVGRPAGDVDGGVGAAHRRDALLGRPLGRPRPAAAVVVVWAHRRALGRAPGRLVAARACRSPLGGSGALFRCLVVVAAVDLTSCRLRGVAFGSLGVIERHNGLARHQACHAFPYGFNLLVDFLVAVRSLLVCYLSGQLVEHLEQVADDLALPQLRRHVQRRPALLVARVDVQLAVAAVARLGPACGFT
mmetsp:Transcript_34792/g.83192  ORF Transcript_34792/g.83192 Transcript_34792/m.83192 type:complete len:726 (-) Transcript_34792:951-3128(-)